MKFLVSILAFIVLALVAAVLYIQSPPGRPTPSETTNVPTFIGKQATSAPVTEALHLPPVQHPYLAKTGINSMHNDAGQTDSYRWSGPLGINPKITTQQYHRILGSCVAQTFDRKGHMIGTCVTPFGVNLVARDPVTLEILADQSITRWLPIGQKFSGGVYFHLDHEDKVLLASNTLHIERWSLEDYDEIVRWERITQIPIGPLLNTARNEDHKVIDVMPDWQGNYWFITRAGLVGVVNADGSNGHAIALGSGDIVEGIDNALAVGENGVFVVSNYAMYNFERASDGSIRQQWREVYDRGSAAKKGTMGFGSGTTPTLVRDEYVAITDNADGKVNVNVYSQRPRDGQQLVCSQGVFPTDRGTSENSMAVVGNGLIVENNFGYSGPRNVPQSEPGIARVNVLEDGSGCELAWENLSITSPTAVPKVSLANGLVYLYTRDEANPDDLHAWYFTAISAETGELVYKQLTGVGWFFNNHYGSISISPTGVAYVGMMGGLVKIEDQLGD
jgi:hypothetical protein